MRTYFSVEAQKLQCTYDIGKVTEGTEQIDKFEEKPKEGRVDRRTFFRYLQVFLTASGVLCCSRLMYLQKERVLGFIFMLMICLDAHDMSHCEVCKNCISITIFVMVTASQKIIKKSACEKFLESR